LTTTVQSVTAFHGARRLASGSWREVSLLCRQTLDQDPAARLLIFNDSNGQLINLDVRAMAPEAIGQPASPELQGPGEGNGVFRGPGRPKLGVVAREVTLLPRHWEWLGTQPGGASIALRKLVQEAIGRNRDLDEIRRAQEAAYRFMSAMAGDEPGYEEAIRALFGGVSDKFSRSVERWPAAVRDYATKLAAPAFRVPQKAPGNEEAVAE